MAIEINSNLLLAGWTILVFVGLAQVFLAVYMAACLRAASRERASVNREAFGLLRKLEGLTASRREQMLKQYDKMLESLSTRLPPAIAAQTGTMIFETESKILNRLAELEPSLKTDEVGRKKMDELIKSMENLEATIVSLTAETVRTVMVESRRNLLADEPLDDISLAA